MTKVSQDVTTHRQQLAQELVDRGKLRTPEWRAVFERVPRHLFVPSFYAREDPPDGPTVWRELTEESGSAWLDAVYANETHVISLDPQTRRPAPGGGWHGTPTSSSTLPGVMATMLDQLDVRDGASVLEIGTGTGYTCALLCERLAPTGGVVVSVDIDPHLVDEARRRLHTAGYQAQVHTADGADGYPALAPYDRIIATCSVQRIPATWLAQTRTGGMILADIRGPVGGALARLTVNADGTARGDVPKDGAYFMPMRRHATQYDDRSVGRLDSTAVSERTTEVDPMVLYDFAFAFVAQLHLPDVHTFQVTDVDDVPHVELQARDGSWARVPIEAADSDGTRTAYQGGPGRLWDTVEHAYHWWRDHDWPEWDRFGITITAGSQQVWFGDPDHPVPVA